jgi:hypothetical protein
LKTKHWIGIFFIFVGALFTIGEIFAFVYDIEPSSHIIDEWLSETSLTENPPTFQEWMDRQDNKHELLLDIVGDECDNALNFWYSPQGYGHNDRD